jgi:hypothetical protein
MTDVRMFFGRDVPGGGFVSDAAWSAFADKALTPAFPDGFTVYDALGQWRSPRDSRIVREKTLVVQIDGAVSPASVQAVSEAYRTQFHQVAVGVVSTQVCAAF